MTVCVLFARKRLCSVITHGILGAFRNVFVDDVLFRIGACTQCTKLHNAQQTLIVYFRQTLCVHGGCVPIDCCSPKSNQLSGNERRQNKYAQASQRGGRPGAVVLTNIQYHNPGLDFMMPAQVMMYSGAFS